MEVGGDELAGGVGVEIEVVEAVAVDREGSSAAGDVVWLLRGDEESVTAVIEALP